MMTKGFYTREVYCWIAAAALHALLFLWTANPYTLMDMEFDPIISVDMIIEQADQLGFRQAAESDEGGGGILSTIKRLLGFSDKVMKETSRTESLQTGDMSQKILSRTPLKDFQKEPLLANKTPRQSFQKISVDRMASSSELAQQAEASSIARNKAVHIDPSKQENLTDKKYRVARSELPFEVAQAPGGLLATGSVDGDSPVVAIGAQTDKGVFQVSKKTFHDKGSYADSSESGGGGLSGTGGFSGRAPNTGSSSPAGGGLSGSGKEGPGQTIPTGSGGKGRSYGSGARGFSGAGSSEGGVAGRDTGAGTALATGSGGAGRGSGKTGGGDRVLFELTGPLSNRRILRQVIPRYPEWAQKKGIIAWVSLHFFVLHDGIVKNNIVIQRTSGYPKLDKTAMDALIKWKFAPLPSSQYGKEQWGIITFKFKIR